MIIAGARETGMTLGAVSVRIARALLDIAADRLISDARALAHLGLVQGLCRELIFPSWADINASA